MGRRMPAMHRDHPVNECRDAVRARRLEVRGSVQYLKHFIEVPSTHGIDQRELVREILIKGTDAGAGCFRNRVGGEPCPAALAKNVSSSVENCVDSGPRTRLLRPFAHRPRGLGNASSQASLLNGNMSNMLAF